MRRFIMLLVLACVAGFAYVAYAKIVPDKKASPQAAGPVTVPVMAVAAQARAVPIILRGLGTVTAYNSVALQSRVEGAITQINFKEGQAVHTGDVLIQLDPRPYQAVLEQAQATFAKDQAGLANAKTNLTRYGDLLKQNFTPQATFDNQKTTVSQDEASGTSDQAAINSAQLNLDYTSLRSPIDGVTGIRQVDIGNLIQANSAQTLVTITQIKPIYVIFTLPEADIDRVRAAMAKQTLAVQVFKANDQTKIAEGTLDLIDNAVDATTGTVKLKAEFKNDDEALWPGQFVNVHVVLNTVENGIVIPSAAVQAGPSGSFTYVVDDKSRAQVTPITVLQTEDNEALVDKGLTAGQQVVTAGQFRLQPGAAVKVYQQVAATQTLSFAPAGTGATP